MRQYADDCRCGCSEGGRGSEGAPLDTPPPCDLDLIVPLAAGACAFPRRSYRRAFPAANDLSRIFERSGGAMTPSCAPIRCHALWIVLLGNRDPPNLPSTPSRR